MSPCRWDDGALLAWADGEVGPTGPPLGDHVGACAHCQGRLQRWALARAELVAAVGAWAGGGAGLEGLQAVRQRLQAQGQLEGLAALRHGAAGAWVFYRGWLGLGALGGAAAAAAAGLIAW